MSSLAPINGGAGAIAMHGSEGPRRDMLQLLTQLGCSHIWGIPSSHEHFADSVPSSQYRKTFFTVAKPSCLLGIAFGLRYSGAVFKWTAREPPIFRSELRECGKSWQHALNQLPPEISHMSGGVIVVGVGGWKKSQHNHFWVHYDAAALLRTGKVSDHCDHSTMLSHIRFLESHRGSVTSDDLSFPIQPVLPAMPLTTGDRLKRLALLGLPASWSRVSMSAEVQLTLSITGYPTLNLDFVQSDNRVIWFVPHGNYNQRWFKIVAKDDIGLEKCCFVMESHGTWYALSCIPAKGKNELHPQAVSEDRCVPRAAWCVETDLKTLHFCDTEHSGEEEVVDAVCDIGGSPHFTTSPFRSKDLKKAQDLLAKTNSAPLVGSHERFVLHETDYFRFELCPSGPYILMRAVDGRRYSATEVLDMWDNQMWVPSNCELAAALGDSGFGYARDAFGEVARTCMAVGPLSENLSDVVGVACCSIQDCVKLLEGIDASRCASWLTGMLKNTDQHSDGPWGKQK